VAIKDRITKYLVLKIVSPKTESGEGMGMGIRTTALV
jgi:hypothetical protein